MADAVYVCCWQCSEYNPIFTYVLNVINELRRKKISTNFTNILDRINIDKETKVRSESIEPFSRNRDNSPDFR